MWKSANAEIGSPFEWLTKLGRACMWPWTVLIAGAEDLGQKPAGNLPALDVLRSLAITLVLLYHLRADTPNALFTLKTPFVRFGWTGVDLFFVLSGLLIGGQLWKELKNSGTLDVGRFILRRGFRIWPLYYSVVLFLLAEEVLWGRARPGLWMDATFLSNYFHFLPGGRHQVAGGWSLSLEEQFYLLTPILLVLVAKFVSPKKLFGLGLLWLCTLPVIRAFTLQGLRSELDIHTAIYYPFQTHSDGLAVGLLIAWLMVWKPDALRAGRWLDGLLVVVFAVSFGLWYVASPTFLFTAVAVSYGALTLLLLRIPLPALLRSKAFYVVSRLSYGFYLIHSGLLDRVMPWHARLFGQRFPGFATAFVLWGAVSLALSFVTFSFIELPFLKLREHLLAKRRVAAAEPVKTLSAAAGRA